MWSQYKIKCKMLLLWASDIAYHTRLASAAVSYTHQSRRPTLQTLQQHCKVGSWYLHASFQAAANIFVNMILGSHKSLSHCRNGEERNRRRHRPMQTCIYSAPHLPCQAKPLRSSFLFQSCFESSLCIWHESLGFVFREFVV
jgi:hypothetical protein